MLPCLAFSRRAAGLTSAITFALLGFLLITTNPAAAKPPKAKGGPKVTMVIEKRGTITIELMPKAAPKTVAHFLSLVKKKFYDGILFHRVVEGFVAQAGDPKSKEVKPEDIPTAEAAQARGLGVGGSGENVPLETGQAHEKGTLGLARSAAPDSGDSQFFLNLVANHRLDSGYCVFGKIADKKGLEVMDKIKQGDRITSIRVK